MAGEIVEANDILADTPETVNAAAESSGWFFKIKFADMTELDGLMDEAAYRAFIA